MVMMRQNDTLLDLEFFIETDSSVIHAKIVESASEGRYNANLKNKKFS